MSSPEPARPPGDLDLIVVGDCNPDVVVSGDVTPEFGQRERLVDSMALMVGGSAAITAVAAARLGLRVALVAAVGDDPAAELMLSLLAKEGVDTSAVTVRLGIPTGMTTVISRGSDRAILTAPGAVATLTAADVRARLLARAKHLHVSSYFLLEKCLGPGLCGLLAAARAAGLSVSLDTNDDPACRWGGDQLRSALAQTDIFLPNEAEALAISGQHDLTAALATLSHVCRTVVVKLAARGALCVPDRSGAGPAEIIQVRLPAVVPVDTTGAGDCFNAGLIKGLLSGLDLPHAVGLGCAVGAASTQAPGGTGATVDLQTASLLARAAVMTRL